MKGKNLQQRILSSKAIIQIGWIIQKFYRQAKAKRIQHHQISVTINPKGTSLGRKEEATTKIKKITNWKDHR